MGGWRVGGGGGGGEAACGLRGLGGCTDTRSHGHRAALRQACHHATQQGPALPTCHRCRKRVGLFQLLPALKPGRGRLGLLLLRRGAGLVRGPGPAATAAAAAASGLQAAADLGESRARGSSAWGHGKTDRARPWGLLPAGPQPLPVGGQLHRTWEQRGAETPNRGAARLQRKPLGRGPASSPANQGRRQDSRSSSQVPAQARSRS